MGGMASASGAAMTVIAQGVRVEGDFKSHGDVLIEGEVDGQVSVAGMLSIGTDAKLKADVHADRAVVAGSIEGNLTVASHLELKPTASVAGDVTCQTATIESGARLNGRVMIGASEPKPSKRQESKIEPKTAQGE